jgi:hypothetical protein
LQQELLSARREIETQATQILSLEAALMSRPELPPDAPENEKDRLIAEQNKTIRELEIVVRGYEENLGEPLRAVREDVENEWASKLELECKAREEKEAWAAELVRELDKEKKVMPLPCHTTLLVLGAVVLILGVVFAASAGPRLDFADAHAARGGAQGSRRVRDPL